MLAMYMEVSLSWLYHCFKAAASAWSSEPLPLVPVPSRVAWLFLGWWWKDDESEDSRNCRMGTKSLKTKFSEDLLELRLINNVSQTICLKGVFRTSASISPLALTIVLSVRKFLSVVVSRLMELSNKRSCSRSVGSFYLASVTQHKQGKEDII